ERIERVREVSPDVNDSRHIPGVLYRNCPFIKTYTTEDGLADNYVWSIAIDADNVKWFGTDGGVSSFDEGAVSVENTRDMPAVIDIRGNFPNPFNPFTTIEFSLDAEGFITLDIFNISGQKINTLFVENLPAGFHSVRWDGRDANGSAVSSGIYFFRLIMGDYAAAHRMVLVR
ncbi:MAG TPA: T9SS type A sorting domain-containing protein, partial [bacterium]|nr:T9SS type A sorting domain-containing protein [bacterium]